jgi:glycosyltransferase involved in cell wall biosynthesis
VPGARAAHGAHPPGSRALTEPLVPPSIVCLSSIDWDFLWQGHQQIMAAFADSGSRVLFVENSGVRAPGPRDVPRLGRRLRHWWHGDGPRGLREVAPRLSVLSPLLRPFPYSSLALRVNLALLHSAIGRWVDRGAVSAPLFWTFLPTPLALETMRRLHPRLSIYYCIDDLASSSPGARRIASSEERMFKEADLVFVTSRALHERASRYSERVHAFPFGVDFAAFDRVRTTEIETPSGLRDLAYPIVGYVGGIHQWVDQNLLVGIAERLPRFTFVFVGPVQCDVSALSRCANIRLLGSRAHEAVPRYLRHFDVGIIPYRRCPYTDHVYPTKLNEYLAMGLPVVATEIPELRVMAAEHPGLLALATTPGDFAEAVQEALTTDSPAARQQRVEVARQNSWPARISQMREVIADALGKPRE